MKSLLIKTGVGIISFIAALMVFGNVLNKGNTDMTIEMARSSFPEISFLSGNEVYNPTVGYISRRNAAFSKENITPLGENRSVAFEIRPYGNRIDAVFLEVRSSDGSRLIEDSEVKNISQEDGRYYVYTSLKDLLAEGGEYDLTVRLTVNGEDIFYNTKVVENEEIDVRTFLEFCHDFTRRTFGEKEDYTELKKYLESNSSGDNSNFGKVDIHSSLEQVTWGNLPVNPETEIQTKLITAEKDNATLKQYYLVQIGTGNGAEHYRVEEYFRLKRGTDRLHLIEYERTLSRLVFEQDQIFYGDTVYLGVDDGSITMEESPEGSRVAFVKDSVLFVADPGSNKFARAYGEYDKEDYDKRPLCELPQIRIFDVRDDGVVDFAVYGYISRGIHEGETGLLVYTYNLEKNTLEEQLFVPFAGSPQLLKENLNQLLYLNESDNLFFYLNGGIYRAVLKTDETETLADGLSPKMFCVNDTHTMAAWVTKENGQGAEVIILKNLSSMREVEISAKSGELMKLLGFMKDDLIFGTASASDVSTDAYGNVFFPMYNIRIQTEDGTIHKQYEQSGIYVTDCIFEDNMISLVRMVRSEDGNFSETSGDTIVDNTPADVPKNKLEAVVTENYETVWQLKLTKEFDEKVLETMQPKVTLFEENRELEIPFDSASALFFVYARGEVIGIWDREADAVRQAYETGGFVRDAGADFIWEKCQVLAKNQIMAIKETGLAEGDTSLGICLETMMQLEGFSQDADRELARGKAPKEILEKYMMDRRALDLTGCSVEVLYYYLNQDIPVTVIMNDGSAILLTGYNSGEFVWMDPAAGTLRKVSKSESARIFAENNNRFLTYIRK